VIFLFCFSFFSFSFSFSDGDREVPTSEGKTLAEKFDVPFFETSAKTRVNVDEVFFELVRLVKHYKTETIETDDAPNEQAGCCVLF
jgi:GTPase SAR1 family protein